MSRYPLYFLLSLGMHAGVVWLLRELPAEAGSRVIEEAPITIQLVQMVPLEPPAEKQAEILQKPAEAPREHAVAASPKVEQKPVVIERVVRPQEKRAVTRPVASESVATKPAVGPKSKATHAEPTRPAEETVAQVAAPPIAVPKREVFRSKPSFLSPPLPPIYPAQAKRRNQQGVVLVEVRLDEYGKLVELTLLRSSGVESLDRSAMKAVAAWRFRAEIENGQTVPSRVHIPIEFALTASR